jgi:hypothetical protein
MKLKINPASMPYESPQCATLDLQEQMVLCSSSDFQPINDFTLTEDEWN